MPPMPGELRSLTSVGERLELFQIRVFFENAESETHLVEARSHLDAAHMAFEQYPHADRFNVDRVPLLGRRGCVQPTDTRGFWIEERTERYLVERSS